MLKRLEEGVKREEFEVKYREICDEAGKVLFNRGMEVFGKMMPDEVYSMQGEPVGGLGNAAWGYRLPKIIVQIAAERIEPEFGAESTVKDVKRLRRILKHRM